MSYRTLLGLGAVVLLAAAASTIDVPPVVWNPTWPIRLGIGGAGVYFSLVALLDGRKAQRP